MGAVATTVIAGVFAVRKNLGADRLTDPDGHHPPGQANRKALPRIKDFVPLADLADVEFGGWDIFEDNAFQAASNARVLEPALLEKIRPELKAFVPCRRCSSRPT